MNDIRVRADDRPVSRVQRLPAAPHAQSGGDPRQGVARLDGVAGRGSPAGEHQHGPGVDHVRIRADDRPVGLVQCLPAAPHVQCGGDAGQCVTRPHDIPRGHRGGLCRRRGRRGHVQGDLGSTTRHADARLSSGNRPCHAGHQEGEQQAPGKHHARGTSSTHARCVTFLPLNQCRTHRSGTWARTIGKERTYAAEPPAGTNATLAVAGRGALAAARAATAPPPARRGRRHHCSRHRGRRRRPRHRSHRLARQPGRYRARQPALESWGLPEPMTPARRHWRIPPVAATRRRRAPRPRRSANPGSPRQRRATPPCRGQPQRRCADHGAGHAATGRPGRRHRTGQEAQRPGDGRSRRFSSRALPHR